MLFRSEHSPGQGRTDQQHNSPAALIEREFLSALSALHELTDSNVHLRTQHKGGRWVRGVTGQRTYLGAVTLVGGTSP